MNPAHPSIAHPLSSIASRYSRDLLFMSSGLTSPINRPNLSISNFTCSQSISDKAGGLFPNISSTPIHLHGEASLRRIMQIASAELKERRGLSAFCLASGPGPPRRRAMRPISALLNRKLDAHSSSARELRLKQENRMRADLLIDLRSSSRIALAFLARKSLA